MESYLNPWAAEVIARHPEISLCDQWKFVEDSRDGTYTDSMGVRNVHFNGEPTNALG